MGMGWTQALGEGFLLTITTKAPWLVLMATSILLQGSGHNLEGSLAIITHGIFFSSLED